MVWSEKPGNEKIQGEQRIMGLTDFRLGAVALAFSTESNFQFYPHNELTHVCFTPMSRLQLDRIFTAGAYYYFFIPFLFQQFQNTANEVSSLEDTVLLIWEVFEPEHNFSLKHF